VVVEQLRRLLRSPQLLATGFHEAAGIGKREMARALAALDETWDQLPPGEQERIVRSTVTRVEVHPHRADVQFSREGLAALMTEMNDHRGAGEA
jgi:hypothetical protein